MENGIYVSLSRQTALRRQLEVAANNIANMNTTGFKKQSMLFTEFLERPGMHEQVSFVQDRAVVRHLQTGPMMQTGNPLDLALTGNGYFTFDTMSGPRYGRAGNFMLNDERQIVNGSGLPVLDTNGQAITIPAGARDIMISGDGTVSTELGEVARLNIVTFPTEQMMIEVGGGLYVSDEEPQPAPAETRVSQGALEGSNVSPVLEMTSMLEIQRQYQSNQRFMDSENERLRTMIQRLGRSA